MLGDVDTWLMNHCTGAGQRLSSGHILPGPLIMSIPIP